MIVAVFAVLAVDVPVDHVVDVAVVRNRDVRAADAVNVIARMRSASVRRIAGKNVDRAQLVFVDVIVVRVVEMPVVHVVDVIFMEHGQMTARIAVLVWMALVDVLFVHIRHRSTVPRGRQGVCWEAFAKRNRRGTRRVCRKFMTCDSRALRFSWRPPSQW